MKPYNVKVHVRNNLLLSAIEDAGFRSQSEFARYAGIELTALNSLIGFRAAPILESGEFSRVAREVMEALGACPSDLWTEEQLTMKLKRNTASAAVDLAEIECLLHTGRLPVQIENDFEKIERRQLSERIRELIFDGSLTERESRVLRMRFGIELDREYSLQEIGDMFGVTSGRIQQVEAKALRKLRHPSRADKLKVLISPDGLTDKERRERKKMAENEDAKWTAGA